MQISSATQRLLLELKTQGSQTAQSLAGELKMTSMGARQHLLKLEQQGLVDSFEQRESVGRPKQYWRLTEQGHNSFPNSHHNLNAELIDGIVEVFGEDSMEDLLQQRQRQQLKLYQFSEHDNLEKRLQIIAKQRSDEGYMATVEKNTDGSFELIENHCAICTAAQRCNSICKYELQLFAQLLDNIATVQRRRHILSGERCCSYQVTPVK